VFHKVLEKSQIDIIMWPVLQGRKSDVSLPNTHTEYNCCSLSSSQQ